MKSAIKVLICVLCLFSMAIAREDNRTYTGHLDTVAVWIQPTNIKVYIDPSYKPGIFSNAFDIWDRALRNDLKFKCVNNSNQADISIE